MFLPSNRFQVSALKKIVLFKLSFTDPKSGSLNKDFTQMRRQVGSNAYFEGHEALFYRTFIRIFEHRYYKGNALKCDYVKE